MNNPAPPSWPGPVSARRWQHLAAQIFHRPSRLAPAMFASSAQTQVMLQLSGSLEVSLDTDGRHRHYHTTPGSLFLTSPNQPDFEMAWQSTSAEPVSFLELCLDNDLLAQTAAADAGLDAARLELRDGSNLDDPLLGQLCGGLARELSRPESRSELYADTAARMLAMQLVRQHGVVRPRAREPRLSPLPPQTVRRLGEHVRARLGQPVTLDELAAVAGLSPYYFCRVFRRTVGASPNEYVIAQRLAHAAHLLRRTRLTVAHVASEVGYASERHFARLFRRRYGCSPVEWARQRLR